jgi:thiaminase/transcriptional activator TenA
VTGAAAALRGRHAGPLDAFLHHRLFREAEAGTLPASARDAYFTAERGFVGAARCVFAHLLLKAPDLGAARHVVGILDGLVNAQEPLFDGIYDRLGLTGPARPAPATHALSAGMEGIVRDGPYLAGLAAMLAAEWTYAQVATRGDWSRADPTMRDWMELHAGEGFLSGVRWLEGEIERAWTAEHAAAADAAFARAIELELAFHDAPLGEAASG